MGGSVEYGRAVDEIVEDLNHQGGFAYPGRGSEDVDFAAGHDAVFDDELLMAVREGDETRGRDGRGFGHDEISTPFGVGKNRCR